MLQKGIAREREEVDEAARFSKVYLVAVWVGKVGGQARNCAAP